jgi:HEAT repeats
MPRNRTAAAAIMAISTGAAAAVAVAFLVRQQPVESQASNENSQREPSAESAASTKAPERKLPIITDARIVPLFDTSLTIRQRSAPLTSVPLDEWDAHAQAGLLALIEDSDDNEGLRDCCINLARDLNASALTEVLRRALVSPRQSDRFRSFAVQHLFLLIDGMPPDAAASAAIMQELGAALTGAPPLTTRELAFGLAVRGNPVAIARLDAALRNDAASSLRSVAIRWVRQIGGAERLHLVRSCLVQTDTETVIAAVECLGWHGDTTSRPQLQAFSTSADQDLRQAALLALHRLEHGRG